jgi:glycosyltransferase involved in cell wall biosynthesis
MAIMTQVCSLNKPTGTEADEAAPGPPARRLRIAYVIINYNKREGTSRAIAEVAERLAPRHDVDLYAATAEGLAARLIHWHRIPGLRYPHLAEFLTFYLPCSIALDTAAYDIVHAAGAVFVGANVYGIQNIQPAKDAVVRRFAACKRTSPLRRFSRWCYLRFTTRVEGLAYGGDTTGKRRLFIAASAGVARELEEHYSPRDARVKVIPNGADLNLYRPLPPHERQHWRRHFGMDDDDCALIFSGCEWRRKGLDLAIRALALLPSAKIKLLVLGKDSAEPEFREMATQSGVAERVIFAGYQKDIHLAYGSADAMLFPSWYEAMSLAMIEAAASGLPVFTTRINGSEDFILDGVNGAFIQPDPAAIGKVLSNYVTNPDRLREMGGNARRIVETKYHWDYIAQNTENAYHDLLREAGI